MNEPLTRERIVESAIGCFVRFGVRKSAMADVAQTAGVSRQTVYDLFGNKDELIRASIRAITAESLANIERRWALCVGLADRLDVYFEETVLKSYELLQSAHDPEDLISGHNEAGASAIAESHAKHAALMAQSLAAYSTALSEHNLNPDQFAHYIVSVAMGFKYVKDRDELNQLLASLRASVLMTVGAH
ncbi:MAG: TetR/AcrR family transcriptional regulator [Pseudomonadota bacterium]